MALGALAVKALAVVVRAQPAPPFMDDDDNKDEGGEGTNELPA